MKDSTTMTKFSTKQLAFLQQVKITYPNATVLTRDEVDYAAKLAGLNLPQWLTADTQYRAGRGQYRIPSISDSVAPSAVTAVPASDAPKAKPAPTVAHAAQVPVSNTTDTSLSLSFMGGASLIPDRLATYVPFGAHKDIALVTRSRKFYPVYITGLSGNGKTTTIEQACAENKREFFRVNITPETSEDDLLGGFRLIAGETVWVDGPVIVAMKRGGILLLDEVDLGTVKIMCLQPVLEGKRIFIKKTNQWVAPAEGFNVYLTGNTKGRGDDTGKFIGTNCMNEAFLDRVPETIEQDYPTAAVETKIVNAVLQSLGVVGQETFATALVQWAGSIRKTYTEGEVDDVVTTRRLVQAAQAYSIYGDRLKAVEKVTTRFDSATRAAFIDLYKKLDAEAEGLNTEALGEAPTYATSDTAQGVNPVTGKQCPF